jgi:hypothetical protein
MLRVGAKPTFFFLDWRLAANVEFERNRDGRGFAALLQ